MMKNRISMRLFKYNCAHRCFWISMIIVWQEFHKNNKKCKRLMAHYDLDNKWRICRHRACFLWLIVRLLCLKGCNANSAAGDIKQKYQFLFRNVEFNNDEKRPQECSYLSFCRLNNLWRRLSSLVKEISLFTKACESPCWYIPIRHYFVSSNGLLNNWLSCM